MFLFNVIQVVTGLTKANLRGVKPSDLLGDLEVCDAFRRRSNLISRTTTPVPTASPLVTTPEVTAGEDAQRGRSGSRTFDPLVNNRIPSTGKL